MQQNLPDDCTEQTVGENSPFVEPIGICAECAAPIFADEEALCLPNGALCAHCLATMEQETLAEWVDALAPFAYSAQERAALLDDIRPER